MASLFTFLKGEFVLLNPGQVTELLNLEQATLLFVTFIVHNSVEPWASNFILLALLLC
jgi:hypothetical protein